MTESSGVDTRGFIVKMTLLPHRINEMIIKSFICVHYIRLVLFFVTVTTTIFH